MKRKIKTIMIAFFLVLILPLNVFAQNLPKKDEIVYISTDTRGKVVGKYVVNIFDFAKADEVTDFGDYEKLVNLTDLEQLSQNDGKIKIKSDKGKFFYQGNNPKAELPWLLDFKYFHEKKEVNAVELLGKSGNIVIKGKITPNPKADKMFTNYYIGQLTFEIESKNAIVKSAKDSSLAYQGSIQILNYTVLPEKDLAFEIELNAKEFELLPIKFSAIPFNMNFELPDMDAFTDQLAQLEDGIKKVGDGTFELTNGINLISENTTKLYKSLFELSYGINQIAGAQGDITDGTSKFHDGLKEYSTGIGKFVGNIEQMGSGLEELKVGLTQLKDGSENLTKGLEDYNKGLSEYLEGVSKLSDGHLELTNGIKTIVDESPKLIEGGKQLVEGSAEIYNALEILDNLKFLEKISKEDMENLGKIIDEILKFWEKAEINFDLMDAKEVISKITTSREELKFALENIEAQISNADISQLIERLGLSDLENEDVKKLLKEFENLKDELLNTKENLEKALNSIENFINQYDIFEKIVDSIKSDKELIKEKLEPLRDALKKFDSDKLLQNLNQISSFRSEYKKFHDGLVEYTNGNNLVLNGIKDKLYPGSIEISNGLSLLKEGGKELGTNFPKIIDGSIAISKGLRLIVEKLDFGDISQVVKLKEGIDLLVANHGKILNGQESLKSGLIQVSNGLGKYIDGFGKFDTGVSELSDGASKLNDGTKELSNRTDGMAVKAKEQMDEALKAFRKDGFKRVSFTDPRNTNINLVQFVYISEALKIQREKDLEVEMPELSIWEKILNLFK